MAFALPHLANEPFHFPLSVAFEPSNKELLYEPDACPSIGRRRKAIFEFAHRAATPHVFGGDYLVGELGDRRWQEMMGTPWLKAKGDQAGRSRRLDFDKTPRRRDQRAPWLKGEASICESHGHRSSAVEDHLDDSVGSNPFWPAERFWRRQLEAPDQTNVRSQEGPRRKLELNVHFTRVWLLRGEESTGAEILNEHRLEVGEVRNDWQRVCD